MITFTAEYYCHQDSMCTKWENLQKPVIKEVALYALLDIESAFDNRPRDNVLN